MIYLGFTFFLDIFLSLFISVSYQNINLLFPCILVGCFPVYYFLVKNRKIFFILLIVTGIIYDTLFSDIFLINTYYYLFYGLFIYSFYENHNPSILNISIISVLGVCFYDVYIFFILIFIQYSVFNLSYLTYKIKNTFLINLVYLTVSILLLRSRIFGLKRRKKR